MRALTKKELQLVSGGGAVSDWGDITINFDDDLEFDLDVDLSGFQLSDLEVSAVNNKCTTSTFPSTVFGGQTKASRVQLYKDRKSVV